MYEEQCPLQWKAGPTFMQHGSKALSSVSLSAEGCQNQAEAWVQICDGDAPSSALLYHQKAPTRGRHCPPSWGCHCPPHHSHSPGPSCWPFSPVLTSSAFGPPWHASSALWSASALKPFQSPTKPIRELKTTCRACPK